MSVFPRIANSVTYNCIIFLYTSIKITVPLHGSVGLETRISNETSTCRDGILKKQPNKVRRDITVLLHRPYIMCHFTNHTQWWLLCSQCQLNVIAMCAYFAFRLFVLCSCLLVMIMSGVRCQVVL